MHHVQFIDSLKLNSGKSGGRDFDYSHLGAGSLCDLGCTRPGLASNVMFIVEIGAGSYKLRWARL